MLAYAHTLKHPPLVARTHPTATSLSYNQPVKHAAGVLSSPQETIWRNSLKIKREREKSDSSYVIWIDSSGKTPGVPPVALRPRTSVRDETGAVMLKG